MFIFFVRLSNSVRFSYFPMLIQINSWFSVIKQQKTLEIGIYYVI